jgi:hypothetical protein
MPKNLILAYVATWVIHLGYISHLVRKYKQTRRNTLVPPSASGSAINQ